MDKMEELAKAMYAAFHDLDWETIGQYTRDEWRVKARKTQDVLAQADYYVTND